MLFHFQNVHYNAAPEHENSAMKMPGAITHCVNEVINYHKTILVCFTCGIYIFEMTHWKTNKKQIK